MRLSQTVRRAFGLSLPLALLVLMTGHARAEDEQSSWLGVMLKPAAEGETDAPETDQQPGLEILRVLPHGPAAEAGLRAGDVLLQLGDAKVTDFGRLQSFLAERAPGTRIRFVVRRDGRLEDGQLVLAARPTDLSVFEEEEEGVEEDDEDAEEEERESEAGAREVAAARKEIAERRKKLEGAIRETRAALEEAVNAGRESQAKELTGKLVDLAREAGRAQVHAEMLERHAAELRGRTEGPPQARNPEREAGERQIEVLRLAMKALMEADKPQGAERLEQRVHAIKTALAGRQDAEAKEIRAAAPGDMEVAEWVGFAAHFYREHDMPDRADMCQRLSEQFAQRARAQHAESRAGELERLRKEIIDIREALERLEKAVEAAGR